MFLYYDDVIFFELSCNIKDERSSAIMSVLIRSDVSIVDLGDNGANVGDPALSV